MLTDINETGLIVIAALFEIFAIWQFNLPVGEAVVTQAWAVIIALLSAFGIGVGGVVRYLRIQIDKAGEAALFKLQVKGRK